MKWWVILTNPYRKVGAFKDQVSADKYDKSTGETYKIICKDF